MEHKKKLPLVDILIINYNGKKIIEECLDSIYKFTDYPNYNVVVIDNGSTDNSIKVIKKYKKAHLIYLPINLGFARGYNEGIKDRLKSSKADYLLLLNNDIVITDKKWIHKLVMPFLSKKDVGITAGALVLPSGKRQTGGWMQLNGLTMSFERKNLSRKDCYLDFPQMAAALVKRDTWIKAEGFDGKYHPFLTEEKDFSVRVRKQGYKRYYVSNLTLIHKAGLTVKKEDALFRYYIAKRNFIRFRFLHYPLHWIFLSFFLDYKSFLNIFIIRNKRSYKFNIRFLKYLKYYFLAFLYNILSLGEIINRRIMINKK